MNERATISGWRVFVLVVLVLLIIAGITYRLSDVPASGPPAPDAAPDAGASAAAPAQPHVVFVVLDMLRADRLSLCGYERPTTPTLERLRDTDGVSASCRAYAPGTWTLPSHASFFTGEEVPVHGADSLLDSQGAESVSLWGDRVRPLGRGLPTLAERMRDAGYRTVLVSGNPIVSRWAATGLARGFETVRASRAFGDLYGDRLVAAARAALDETAAGAGPMFLFVNVCDAHHPWSPVPPGIDWAPPRPALDNRPRIATNPYPRFLRGELGAAERAAFLAHASDAYDYAVHRADRTFGKLLALLEERGLLAGDYRLVVVSDHGEFLGEHDLLSHATFVYEPDTRVPLLFRDSARRALPLPEPLSALAAHDLALTGALPDPARPVRAAGYPDGLMSELFGERLIATTAAEWRGSEKLWWSNGEYRLLDLEADPGELAPAPLPADHPGRRSLEGFVAQVQATALRKSEPTPEMIEALRALGYVR